MFALREVYCPLAARSNAVLSDLLCLRPGCLKTCAWSWSGAHNGFQEPANRQEVGSGCLTARWRRLDAWPGHPRWLTRLLSGGMHAQRKCCGLISTLISNIMSSIDSASTAIIAIIIISVIITVIINSIGIVTKKTIGVIIIIIKVVYFPVILFGSCWEQDGQKSNWLMQQTSSTSHSRALIQSPNINVLLQSGFIIHPDFREGEKGLTFKTPYKWRCSRSAYGVARERRKDGFYITCGDLKTFCSLYGTVCSTCCCIN